MFEIVKKSNPLLVDTQEYADILTKNDKRGAIWGVGDKYWGLSLVVENSGESSKTTNSY